ncbi:filamentous hemagglutinin [Pseudacidovorax sp. 1753]|uniref:two-partner secretion domain-containing protein n=1 Tax=Pseudacidovorax sp. 1753 TaxID=3156419 RepID=UPI0033916C09
MNKNFHRVIFNAVRGQRMVVQETATSTGKGRNGASAGTGEGQRPWVLRGLVAALALIGWLPVVHAQIVPNPLALPSQRPQTLVAPNGVPLVNITTPSAGGVSVNHYSQFDVGTPGAILNNSRTPVQSQLGGYIQGNPWLATGPARVIVNQVASSNPSYLNGYVEVAGQRAEVIIANPSGISVNGGGFINASRVTLTTGTPQYGLGGSLDGYVVNGGTVSVDGKGLDLSTTDYAAILSRALQVNAAIYANDLKVVTGANQISADHSQVTAASANGPAPAYALDVAALGGMYAGHIVLVGTEAGLGVRNAGKLGASAGSLVVTSAGRLENTGILEGQSVQLTSASDIDNRGGTIRQTSSASLALAAPTVSNTNGGQIGSEPVSGSSGSSSGSSGGTTSGGSSGGSSGTSSGSSSSGGSSSSTGTSSGGAASAPEPGTLTAAGAILNDGGKIYAGGPITLQTQNLVNNGGTLSVASMSLKQPGFSNQGGTINVSGAFTADLGTLDNTGGTLHAGSLDIATSGDLINVDGTLTSDTDASLQVGGKADNTRGTLSARAAMTGAVAGATDNTSGTLAANSGLSWSAASLSNDKGGVGSANGLTQLNVTGAITNGQGSLGAGTGLQIQSGSLSNAQGGSVRAEGSLQLSTSGALSNEGTITAAGNTAITAGSVSAGTSSVMGAGINKDGTLAASGDLTVTASNTLTANGSNLAAGSLALRGSNVDVSHSTTSASNVSLIATNGNVDTSAAKVVTPGTLTITANANAAQSLVNTAGILNGGQLNINASNIANTAGGQLVQTGTAATAIAVSGTLDNSGGVIAANSQDLSLSATSLVNAGGQIAHAGTGTLTLSGGSFNGAGGEVASNGALAVSLTGAFNQDGGTTSATAISIDAGSLSNKAGQIVQTGAGATHIGVSGVLDNTNGAIASNGQTAVTAGTLTNGGGQIRTADTASLSVSTTGVLDNSHQGTIAAGGNTTVNASSLNNDGGSITAVQNLNATVSGAASNQGGTLAANGNTTLTAASLNNSGGTVAAVQGDLSVTTSGATTNAGGALQAGGSATLINAGLDNSGGKVFGDRLRIDTQGQELGNAQGTIAATHAVELQTGALRNEAGLVQAGGALTIDTHGQALSNTHAAGYANGQGGLASGDTLTLHAGAVDNSGGFIGSKGAMSATTGEVTNAAGQVLGRSTIDWQAGAASFDNGGGQIQSAGNLSLTAGSVTNTAGLLRSGATTTVTASGSVGNRGTQGTDQGIEGSNVAITAGSLDNTQGAVRANGNTTVTSGGMVDNTGGLLSAGDTLRVADPNAANPGAKTLNLVNTGGTLVADQSVVVDAARFSGDGKLVSGKDLALSTSQDLVNNAEVIANGNLSYGTTGNLTNNGKLLAGQQLTVSGSTVTNAAGAEMSGTDTQVTAGTLDNRGLIDSNGLTRIDAGTVNNVGTGRIYGDHVAIAAGTLNNQEEGNSAATIAARADLDLGVGTLNNREHALVFSAGDMAIGGSLDGASNATGRAGTINNASATIESLGDMALAANAIYNTDAHMQVVRVDSGTVAQPATIIPTGLGVEIPWDSSVYTDDNRNWAVNYNGQYRSGKGWTVMMRTETTYTDVAANPADPGRIVSGGDMTIDTGLLRNRDSQVLSGGKMTVDPGVVDNTPTQGQRIVESGGTMILVPGVKGNNLVPGIIPTQQGVYTVDIGTSERAEFVSAASGTAPGSAASGNVTDKAGAAGQTAGGARAPTIVEVASAVKGGASADGAEVSSSSTGSGATGAASSRSVDMVVRTSAAAPTVPNASLFSTAGSAGRNYLVETDPRFANYRNWLSSDYLLNNLGLNPDTTLKRLGDGFYEQKLIRDQVQQLTGYRFLEGFNNDEDQYTALMNAGMTFAQKYGLTPGVALTAEQMAQLTSDIVWLVEKTVTLPDGTTRKVLVPQVYVRVQPGDITGGGSLLSADAMVMHGEGNLVNGGTIAGRTAVSITADNVNNLGRIAGGDVSIKAQTDLNNIGGSITAANSALLTAGRDINVQTTTQSTSGAAASRTNIDRVAGLYVSNPDGVLVASAGRDLNVVGGVISSAGSAALGAVRDVNLGTVTESASRSMAVAGGTGKNRAAGAFVESNSREVGSAVVATDSVRIAAGNDLNIHASAVASSEGALVATAKHDINITAGQGSASLSTGVVGSTRTLTKETSSANLDSTSETSALSSQLSADTVSVVAGNDINAQAAQISALDAATLSAGRDVNLSTATSTSQRLSASQSRSSGTAFGQAMAGAMFSSDATAIAAAGNKKSSSQTSVENTTQAVGTTISAGSLMVASGRNTTITGSTLLADGDITVVAGKDLTIQSAQNTSSTQTSNSSSASGMVGKWTNPTIGNVKSFGAENSNSTTQAPSQVVSLGGDVTLVAGNNYQQTASQVMAAGQNGTLAGGDVNILAKNVRIEEAYNTEQSFSVQRNSSTLVGGSAYVNFAGVGVSTDGNKVSATGPLSALQAMGETDNKRAQALGALTTAMGAKQMADAATSPNPSGSLNYGVSVNVSRNTSQSTSATNSSTAVGSSVVGAGNVNIVATGGGKDSDILVSGSTVAAGNNVTLSADGDITLQASKDTSVSVGQSKGSGESVGVTYGVGAQNGFSIQLGVSSSKGSDNQNDTRYNASQVSAGNAVNIQSGGDLTLNGAVVDANRIKADVGGNLTINTPQDVSVGNSKQSSSGLNVSLCIPPWCVGTVATVSANVAGAKANGVTISPNTQSGLKAGDGGFDVSVKGDTTLVGGVIESTQAAIDKGRNSFETGGTLTIRDLQNVSQSSGSSYAANGSLSLGYTTKDDPNPTWDPKKGQSAAPPGGGAGIGSTSSSTQSVTVAGISGIAGSQSVRTGDNSTVGTLVKDWNTQNILRDVQAQASIVATTTGYVVQLAPDILKDLGKKLFSSIGAESQTPAENYNNQLDEFNRAISESDLSVEQKNALAAYRDVLIQLYQAYRSQYDTYTDELDPNVERTQFIPLNPAWNMSLAPAAAGVPGSTISVDPDTGEISISAPRLPSASLDNIFTSLPPVVQAIILGVDAMMSSALQNSNGGNASAQNTPNVPGADTYGTPPNGASPPPGSDGDKNPNNDRRYNSDGELLGENGPRISSRTTYNNSGVRIDIENPAPGQRAGQIHIQLDGEKYYFNSNTGLFEPAPGADGPVPNYVNRLLQNPGVQRGINTALRYLGERPYFK